MATNLILTKQSSDTEIRSYFKAILELSKSDNEFPVNFDEVWMLVYQDKHKAVNELKDKFIENIDYQALTQKVECKNGIGYSRKIDYYLTVPCLEFFIARKVRAVFEVYRQVFHFKMNTMKAAPSYHSESDKLIDYLKHELEQSKAELEQCKTELYYQRGRMDVEKELAAANAKLEMQDELAKAKTWIMYQESEHRTEIRNGQLILHSKLKTEESGSGNAEQKPKAVKTYNAPCRFGSRGVIERKSPGAMLIREMCQKMREDGIAHVKSSEVFDWLRNNGHLSSAKENFNKPSDECLEKGWIVFSACGSTGSGVRYVTPYITKEGYKHFVGIIMQQGGIK